MNELRNPGTFLSRWVELVEDTPENRFIKTALHFCSRRISGRIRRRLEGVLVEFDAVTISSRPFEDYRLIRFERLPNEYHEVLLLAKSLLEGRGGGFFAGSLMGRSDVIFTPDVFEAFVSQLVREVAGEHGLELVTKRPGRYLGQWETGPWAGKNSFEVKPDFELWFPNDDFPILLLDAKWKRLRPTSANLGVAEDDIYQMVAYGKRFNCDHAVLIYPWMGRTPPSSLHTAAIRLGNRHSTMKLSIACVPLLWGKVSEAAGWLRKVIVPLLPVR